MRQLIHFFGLKRSGNHAVINWLLGNVKGNTRHINNVFDLCEDPPKILSVQELACNNEGKDFTLLLSYEDVDFSNLDSAPGLKHQERILKNAEEIKILLLRDPFNFFASRLKMLSDMQKQDVRNPIQKLGWKNVVRLWKMYAREYLGETNFLGGNKVVVNYNMWSSDRRYRDALSQRCLGTINKDRNVQTVAKHGRGSSFDYTKFDGSAQKMKVLERWRYFKDDDLYLELLRDEELLALSDKIFGSISGTEEILGKLHPPAAG